MKSLIIKYSFLLGFILSMISCSNSDDVVVDEQAQKRRADSIFKMNEHAVNLAVVNTKPGVVGVMDLPEMLTISKMDSAPMRDVSFKVAKAYEVLEQEMNAIGAIRDGMPGMITYNNDTTNFKFECVLPIKEMPKKEPKKCKIVVLEACPMLIYNYFGPYQQMYTAYDKIRKYNSDNKLIQTGPMREFYLSDPTVEKDPAKWQTRIFVPVSKAK